MHALTAVPSTSLSVEERRALPAGRRSTSVRVPGKVITLALAYPLSCNPGSSVAGGGPDVDLFIWTLAWDIHAMLNRPLSIFDANIYYPERLTLAYSENLNWAITPESFLASSARFQVWLLSLFPDARIMENAYAYLFPGWLPILLAAVAIAGLRYPRTPPESTDARTRTFWTHVALVLNLLALASMAVAIAVTLNERIRLRIGDMLLFSARDPVRAWMLCGLCVAARAVIAYRAPFTFSARVHAGWQAFLRWRGARRWNPTMAYAIVTLVSIGLAVGPPLSLWPLVYWLPGMNFIRGPSRFMLLAVLGLAVLAGFGFERLRARVAPARQLAFAVIVGALLLAEFVAVPLDAVPHRVDIPAVDRWLARQPKPFVVVELPLLHEEALHTTYMLHSMAHWQKTVNGYSGIRPPLHWTLFPKLRGFPDEFTVQSLVDLGVTYVVIHADLYPPGEWRTVAARLRLFEPQLRLEHAQGPGLVYSLQSGPADARD